MRITIELDDTSATVEHRCAVTLADAVQLCEQALLAVGYDPECVADVFVEEALR